MLLKLRIWINLKFFHKTAYSTITGPLTRLSRALKDLGEQKKAEVEVLREMILRARAEAHAAELTAEKLSDIVV